MSEKYPNADTSAERLAFITDKFEDGGTYLELDDPNIEAAFRDLLAMIEERDLELQKLREFADAYEELSLK